MGVSSIHNCCFFVIGVAALSTVSCDQGSEIAGGRNVRSSPCDIFQAVMADGELVRNAGGYFKGVRSIRLVWDDVPGVRNNCRGDSIDLNIVRSSGLDVKPGYKYLVANKMYFDGDAAFVELLVLPRGLHGDFFLRKSDKWEVVQRNIWEERQN